MFSSDQGRWFSPDPKAGCGGNPQNHNRYAYVRNNAANGIDPRGDYVCTGDQCSSEESQVCTARDRVFGATTAICTLYAIVSPTAAATCEGVVVYEYIQCLSKNNCF